jgi:hypothetical protein
MNMTIFRSAAVLLACVAALLAAAAAVNDRSSEPASAVGIAPAGEPAVGAQPVVASAATNAFADAANPAIAELQRRVAKLDAETNELRQRLSALAVSAPAFPAAGDPSAQAGSRPARRDAPPPASETQAADRALAESREAAFRTETIDARWSATTVSKLQQALSAADAGAPTVRSLECRSRSCRLEIGAVDPQQLDAFMPGFANRIAGTLGSIAASPVDAADGTQAMLLFLSR